MKKKFFVTLLFLGLFLCSLAMAFAQEEKAPPCKKPFINQIIPKAAAEGTQIKILGGGFGKEAGSVIFPPGIEATLSLWSYQRIILTVPNGTKTGFIQVLSACGEKSNGMYFTVIKGENNEPNESNE
jgi:hypothetical protein